MSISSSSVIVIGYAIFAKNVAILDEGKKGRRRGSGGNDLHAAPGVVVLDYKKPFE